MKKLIPFILILVACKKEDPQPTPEPEPTPVVYQTVATLSLNMVNYGSPETHFMAQFFNESNQAMKIGTVSATSKVLSYFSGPKNYATTIQSHLPAPTWTIVSDKSLSYIPDTAFSSPKSAPSTFSIGNPQTDSVKANLPLVLTASVSACDSTIFSFYAAGKSFVKRFAGAASSCTLGVSEINEIKSETEVSAHVEACNYSELIVRGKKWKFIYKRDVSRLIPIVQ